jgi:hypothetical protein
VNSTSVWASRSSKHKFTLEPISVAPFSIGQRRQDATLRGAINSLMAELMEDHIGNHMPRNSKSSEEAAEDVIEIVKTCLK